jgi:hypothetical protein
MMTDWIAWHRGYDDPDSGLSRRLRVVQAEIGAWLDETAPAPVTVVSACAGDGRDLLQVLAERDDSHRVRATLLEYDRRNVERATRSVAASDLRGITVTCADAGLADSYLEAVPADLLIMCGVFGNMDDDAVRRLIDALPQLCRPGATVIWTRHRRPPDLTGRIRRWLQGVGFEEVSYAAPADQLYSVGRHRLVAEPQELTTGARWFEFNH